MPNTLENTREFDETIVEEDAEVAADEATDEFSQYFQNGLTPKILITTSKGPSAVSFSFTGAGTWKTYCNLGALCMR